MRSGLSEEELDGDETAFLQRLGELDFIAERPGFCFNPLDELDAEEFAALMALHEERNVYERERIDEASRPPPKWSSIG